MVKRIISLLLVIMICLSSVLPVNAHDRDEHDDDIEYVLFGERGYKNTHPIVSGKIQALEDAVYLCVDQYNGNGKDALRNLQNEKIPDIPRSIEEFDFKSNFAHRRFTHRGWNVNYDEKAHWSIRKKILVNTVEAELFSSVKTPLSWFPWLSEKIYGKNNYEQQCESFCALLYYIHIIGDHIEAEKYTALEYIDPLTSMNDRDNPGIIPDLKKYCAVLFEAQVNTRTYRDFMSELENLQERSDKLRRSKGGVNDEKEFIEYHKCAEELLELLGRDIPRMLKKEDFFSKSFFDT